MVPFDTSRLYQIERAKSSAEVRRADQRAAQFAIALSSLFRDITNPLRAIWPPSPGRRAPIAQPGLTCQICNACRG